MRVLCRHGHLAFFPSRAGDISEFSSYYGIDLVRVGGFYTFPLLAEADRYSIAGKAFLNLTATKTYEGREPWDVMRENGFVYLISAGALVHKSNVLISIATPQSGNYFVAPTPLIQAGSRTKAGDQILSYDAEFIQRLFQLRLMGFSYV